MISTKNTCSSRTFSGLFILLLLTACAKTPEPIGVFTDFFPVSDVQDDEARSSRFQYEPILLRLDSRERLNAQVVTTTLDPLEGERLLKCSRALRFGDSTYAAGLNLLETPLARMEVQQRVGANGVYDSHYILFINEGVDSAFVLNNQGLLEFYFEGITRNGFNLIESTSALQD